MVRKGKLEVLSKGAVLRDGSVLQKDKMCFDRMALLIERIDPPIPKDLDDMSWVAESLATLPESTEIVHINNRPCLLVAPVETKLRKKQTVLGRIVPQESEGTKKCVIKGKPYFVKPLTESQREYYRGLIEYNYGRIRYEILDTEVSGVASLLKLPEKEPVPLKSVIDYGDITLQYALQEGSPNGAYDASYYFIVGGDYEMAFTALYHETRFGIAPPEVATAISYQLELLKRYKPKLPALIEELEKLSGVKCLLNDYKEELKKPLEVSDNVVAKIITPEEVIQLKLRLETVDQKFFGLLNRQISAHTCGAHFREEIKDLLLSLRMPQDDAEALAIYFSHPNFLHAIYLKGNIKQS